MRMLHWLNARMTCRRQTRRAPARRPTRAFRSRVVVLERRDLLSFGPGTLYTTGASPQAIAIADLNRDNAPDLITVNTSSNSISVQLGLVSKKGAPTGTFGFARTYDVGPSAVSLVVGDFNGDHINDIAVGGSQGTSVLLGYGDGTFQPAQYSLLALGTYAAAADVNGDGKLDLVTGGAGVSVLLGNGNGTFQAGPTYTASGTAVAVGDFNGDGKLDVVASGVSTVNTLGGPQQAATLFLLAGNGDGTFGAGQAVWDSVQTEILGVTTGDFNGDKTPDLAVASLYLGPGSADRWIDVNMLLGGSGGLSSGSGASLYHIAPSDTLLGLAAADMNRDGKLDLVVVDASGVIDILAGNGDGSLGTEHTYSTTSGLVAFAVGDLNGDGYADLAVTTGSAVDTFLWTSGKKW